MRGEAGTEQRGKGMLDYLSGIWRCRYFWLMLVKNDLRQRYRRSVLGLGWSLLQPVAMTCIICFVFQAILVNGENIISYGAHVLAGLACWNYILTSTLHGCQCLYNGESYIRQYPAPLAIYPLRTALAATFHFAIATLLVVVVSCCIHGPGILLALPVVLASTLILFIACWSLAVLAGFANVYFQDTQHICEVGFQILFYLTPIIYPESLLKQHQMSWVADYNPVRALIDLVRKPILEGQSPAAPTWIMACLATTLLAGLASLTLARYQKRLIFSL
jgi:lipopolysaccharide transport system permease protein